MTKHPNRRSFLGSLKAKRRNARLHRAIKAGTIKPSTKEQMRVEAVDAATKCKITHIKRGPVRWR